MALIPNDKEPRPAAGNTSQLVFAVLVSVIVGEPVLAAKVEDLFAVVPFCTTE